MSITDYRVDCNPYFLDYKAEFFHPKIYKNLQTFEVDYKNFEVDYKNFEWITKISKWITKISKWITKIGRGVSCEWTSGASYPCPARTEIPYDYDYSFRLQITKGRLHYRLQKNV